ncbi:alpha-farnesene synthase isoform X2 [Cajanus cajan]|uniref:alpha-farnesene synthase isoform X2 n=1 Tax=Cajanus cajan TaxID=3821 RepID=UPI0010FAFDAD|nr:alpha-farnesene synthase isoform X2 [Cajanus cajan]
MTQSQVNLSSQNVISVVETIRRSANYKPNIWKYHFLQSLTSKYNKEEFVIQLNQLVMEVKGLFVQETCLLKKLELVDWIQKLGLTNYFQKEINEFLESILVYVQNGNINPNVEQNLHVSALCFRLLRQHGYPVLPDTVSSFLDEKGKVMRKNSNAGGDAKDVVELLEASHLGLEGETILDEAKTCAINSLKDASININQLTKMVHALELPSHWRVPWFDVKWHVEQYKNEKNMNPLLLALAKLNFNMIQATLQSEVKELSRWWENLGIEKELSFARNRWDDKEVDELPEYMRICVHALKDVTDEIAYEIGGENNFHLVLPYLKKAWIDFCNTLYVEAKWYNKGYIPSLQEYLSNAWISSSGPVIFLHSYFATMHQATNANHEIGDFLHTCEDLIYNVSLVIRLCNDLGTSVAERERGDAASSILCYMNEMEASEEKARKHIQDMINKAWRKINGFCLSQVASVEPFVTQALNIARVAHTLYQNGDGFGIQDRDIKKYILSLVVEPL